MTRKERLLITLNGKPRDRPAVNFYENSGLESTSMICNVFPDQSWKPVPEVAAARTDRMAMAGAGHKNLQGVGDTGTGHGRRGQVTTAHAVSLHNRSKAETAVCQKLRVHSRVDRVLSRNLMVKSALPRLSLSS